MTAPVSDLTTPHRVVGSDVADGKLVGARVGARVAVGGISVGAMVFVGTGLVGAAGLTDAITLWVAFGSPVGGAGTGFTEEFKPTLFTARVMARAVITTSQPRVFFGGRPKIMKAKTANRNARQDCTDTTA